MRSWFIPQSYILKIEDLSIEFLKKKNIKGLIFDLDNTMIPWGEYRVTPNLVDLIQRIKDANISICIVSNNRGQSISDFAKSLKIYLVDRAGKPRSKPFQAAMRLMKTNANETAMVGDQLFTDIFGANRVGIYSILVKPISDKEFVGTQFVRKVERALIKKMVKEGEIKL
jgi:hypothetical protein